MEKQRLSAVEEDASSIAMICRVAAGAREASEQLPFLEAVLADLTELRDDLAHQLSALHHPHEEA